MGVQPRGGGRPLLACNFPKAGTGLTQPGAWDEVTMRADAIEGHLDGISEVTLSDWAN
ncbi:MAG: hypothetical protein LBU69_03590 [Deltaproteobacteria bacterium]|nr:hypothetical protein [Deltaproteobacteria bacterium]